jgi:DNA-binding NarL/FixJ family response regulator
VRAAATMVRQALDRWPQARVVVLSSFSHKAFVAEVLRAGAHGYITTRSASQELLDAIRTVASGSTYLCSRMRQSILEGFVQGQADKIESDWPAVTDREAAILQLLGEGRTSKEIAAAMNLSSKTIDACRRQLMQKLDVDSIAGLVKCAIALGLTTIDPWPVPTQ